MDEAEKKTIISRFFQGINKKKINKLSTYIN